MGHDVCRFIIIIALALLFILLASPAPTHGGDIGSEHRGSGLHARPAGTPCMSDTTQGEGDAHTYRPAIRADRKIEGLEGSLERRHLRIYSVCRLDDSSSAPRGGDVSDRQSKSQETGKGRDCHQVGIGNPTRCALAR